MLPVKWIVKIPKRLTKLSIAETVKDYSIKKS